MKKVYGSLIIIFALIILIYIVKIITGQSFVMVFEGFLSGITLIIIIPALIIYGILIFNYNDPK